MPFCCEIIHFERGPGCFAKQLKQSYVSYHIALLHLKHIIRHLYADGSDFQLELNKLLSNCETFEDMNTMLQNAWYDTRYTVRIWEVLEV